MEKWLTISAQEEFWLFGALFQAQEYMLKHLVRHMPIFCIPDIAHTSAARKVAPVGHFHVDPLQGVDGWMQVGAMPVRLDAKLVTGCHSQVPGKLRRQDDLPTVVNLCVMNLCHRLPTPVFMRSLAAAGSSLFRYHREQYGIHS